MVWSKALRKRTVNARYMEPGDFARMVENFKIDGRMTGTVTVCIEPDGGYEILSGHHRTEAAIAAGFEQVEVLCITTPLPEERKVAIQLSHNAINGRDDASILAKMYEGLSIDAKKFSGLTEAVMSAAGNMAALSITSMAPKYEEIILAFLPEDKAALDQNIQEIRKKLKTLPVYANRMQEFEAFFDTLLNVKVAKNIVNTALAVLAMAELAAQKLDEISAEDKNKSIPENP